MLSDKNFYCISSRMENSGQLYGCFKIGPFYGHQSLTFANALRRTLLADKSRCIFEAIQIQGVEHEFSSLVGVRESVIDIILNLEKIVFQINKPITKPQMAIINFKGPGILRAKNLHLPANINCLVPSQYIATVEIDGHLRIKLFFTPNWSKFQQFLHRNILENEDKIFQEIKSPTYPISYPIQKKSIKLYFSQLQKICIPLAPLKSSTFLRYFPLLKNQFLQNSYKNNKINFHEIIDKANLKKKIKFQSIKQFRKPKNQTVQTNLAQTNPLQQIQEIQENFLFIQTSVCAVVKVHYTIQSHPLSAPLSSAPLSSAPLSAAINKIEDSHIFNGFKANSTRRPIRTFQKQLKYQLKFNKNNNKALLLSQKVSNNRVNNSVNATKEVTQSKVIKQLKKQLNLFNRPFNKLHANNEEFIIFEVWTDGSIHPQKAIGKAINEILLELFPYSLYINKNNKINKIPVNTNKNKAFKAAKAAKKLFNYSNVFSSNSLSSNSQRKNISNKNFFKVAKEKFLNLDIGNFSFDIETYIYLKEKKIYRIADFLNFVKKLNKSQPIKREKTAKKAVKKAVKLEVSPINWEKNLNKLEKSHLFVSKSSFLKTTPQIQNTILNFQRFITSCLYN
uniref:Plastid-encoded RNA polymerase subunit alpha n=1 Tax=Pseudochlorodesmis sp. HV01306a TaxID=2358488 RepID=A0A386AXX5_9CHLO|nr:RNA polymerase a-subunit [Pseudochlorodesmis sp. HV01306a]